MKNLSVEINEYLYNAGKRMAEVVTPEQQLEIALDERSKASKAFYESANKLKALTKLSEKLCIETGGHKFKNNITCERCQALDDSLDYDEGYEVYDEQD